MILCRGSVSVEVVFDSGRFERVAIQGLPEWYEDYKEGELELLTALLMGAVVEFKKLAVRGKGEEVL
jgi:hypothetical protein